MKKHLVCLLISGIFLFGTWSNGVFCQAQLQLTPERLKTLRATALANYIPNKFQEEFKSAVGMSGVSTNMLTGEAWIVSMGGNHAANVVPSAQVGFYSTPFSISIDWTGVTVTVKYEVVAVQNVITLGLHVLNQINGQWVTVITGSNLMLSSTMQCSSPNTYEITSSPFNMKANTNYKARALADVSNPARDQATSAYVKIISIKFNLP
jgi:hypothetical protein